VYVVYVYPILFGLFVPLSIYVENSGEILASETIVPFSIIIAVNLGVFGVAHLASWNRHRVAAALAILWVLFFQFGRFNQLASLFDLPRRGVIAAASVVGLGAMVLLFRARRETLPVVSTWLFITALGFSVAPAVLFARSLTVESRATRTRPEAHFAPAVPGSGARPHEIGADDAGDIFFVILDGYGGGELLARDFGLDNTPFHRMLEKRGFEISHQSHSNYPKTLLSLASTLNMTYLDSLAREYGQDFTSTWPLRESINRSRVFEILKRYGYVTNMLASSKHLMPKNSRGLLDHADSYMKSGQYALAVVGNTPLRALHHADRLFLEFDADTKPWVPDSIDWVFEQARPLASNGRKDFVFMHVLAPHSPYYFDENCNLAAEHKSRRWNDYDGPFEAYRVAYGAQLLCVNRKVEAFLDDLEADTRRMPIVILQGDHGPPEILDSVLEREGFDELLFRTSILNAFLVPERLRGEVVDGMTSVNTFRLVLPQITGEPMELLENRSYRGDYRRPYDYAEMPR
jgi:hypothetical protein